MKIPIRLTQRRFAQKVGVTYSTVNHWENGERAPQPFFGAAPSEVEGRVGRTEREASTKEIA